MNRIWKTLATLLATMLVVMMPFARISAQPAQTDQTYVSEITGDEIDLGTSGDIQFLPDNFDFNETTSFQEEFIWFTYDWSNFQVVLISGPNTAEEYHDITLGNMEVFYDSWELVDEEITDEYSWFLGIAEIDGNVLTVYYDFELDAYGDIDLVVMQFGVPEAFAENMEFVQEEVTIGGSPILANADGEQLVAMTGLEDASTPESDDDDTSGRSSRTSGDTDDADATSTPEDDEDTSGRTSRTSGDTDDADATSTPEDDEDTSGRTSRTSGDTDDADATSTPEDDEDTSGRTSRTSGDTDDADATSTPEEDEDTSGRPDRSSRTGLIDDLDDTGRTETDESTPDADVTGDWEAMGLISEAEWESPTYGAVVTWDTATWEFPLDYEYAIVINEDPPYDVVTLQTTDGLGYVYMTVEDAYDSTPRSLAAYWETPEYADQFENGITIVEIATTSDSASVVYETTNSLDQPLFVVVEASFLDDGTIVFSQISAAPETIHEVYGQFLDGVQVNGDFPAVTWTVKDIQDLSGN